MATTPSNFTRSGCTQFWGPYRMRVHQYVTFQHNQPIRGRVNDDSTNFHGPVFRRAIFSSYLSQLRQQLYIWIGDILITGSPNALFRFHICFGWLCSTA